MAAAETWRHALAAWAIPEPILAAAPESPWTFPPALFEQRAVAAVTHWTPSNAVVAQAALPAGGSVLDVGCGAGAASLPLAGQAGQLIGVDSSPELLAAFADRAQATGVAVATIPGRWPDAATHTPVADVVVCHHVVYNVPDLAAFAVALTAHARRRVVVELTLRHPMSALNDLWLHFHGLERPVDPTADHAVAVLRDLGVQPQRQDWTVPADVFTPLDAVAWTRRRLCLPATRDAEIAAFLQDHPRPSYRALVTLWWAGSAA